MFFHNLESILRDGPRVRVVVAGASGTEVFSALKLSEKAGITEALLVGDRDAARAGADRVGMEYYSLLDAKTEEDVTRKSVEAIKNGKAHILIKGQVSTAVFLKAILSDKTIFAKGKLLSHLAILENSGRKILGITDGGMNINPNLDQKRIILESAVNVFRTLGMKLPKVAVLTAMEKENPKILESIDAGKLSRLQDSGEISNCIVEGPVSLDLAVIPGACQTKNYRGKIQGDADILLVPNLSAGNILAKSLIHLGGWKGGGLVIGAGRPVVLPSRSDTAEEKYNSVLLAIALFRHLSPKPCT